MPSISTAVPIVPFAPRFSADDNGTVLVFGNNLLSCPDSEPRCAAARTGTTALNNNAFAMQNLDADADPSTFNSSSSTVAAPPDGEVLWAGLYWGARLSRAPGGVAGVGDRREMSLRTPGSPTYTPIASQASFGPTAGDQAYQEFADVTALVRAAGPGAYWGANVVAGTGEDRYAGWSLVVVYRAPGLPLRSLTVFDGFADVGRDEPQVVSLSGFRTPVTGPVETQLGIVAYEGDFSTSGDNARLNGTLLSTTPLSRGSNFFNGTNDDNGVSVSGRTPAHLNMLGYDVKNLAATGIPNGATSATISLESTGDRYFPGVVTTAIRLFAPDFTTSAKTVANLAGRTPALPGDQLEYTLTYPNTGQDPATDAVLTDVLPAGTTFVSAESSAGTCTAAGEVVTCAIGTIGVGETWQARVRADVGPDAGGTTLRNAAVLDYRAATLGRDLTYVVAPALMPVDAVADLSIGKTLSPDPGVAGGQVTSVLSIANAGPNTATDVVVTDQLPPGVAFVSATTPQGSCAAAGSVVTCRLGSVPNGSTVDVEVVVAVPADSTATSVVNVASVSSTTADLDPGNDAAGGSVVLTREASLRVTKTASPTAVAPGAATTFTVTATNDGPSDAVDVVLTDSVADPALVLTGATAPGATCTVGGAASRCSIPRLAAGASLVMTVAARVSPEAAEGRTLANTATVASSTPDADASDNAATATITTTAPQADLETTKTSSDARAGGQVTYSIVVTNRGPSLATAVTLDDALPAGLSISGLVSSRGECTAGPTITCALGDLPGPDATGNTTSATITVVADIDPSVPPGELVNTATAASATSDPDPADNAATATTSVTAVADVSITKTASPVQPAAGEDVTFTVTVANAGPSTARDVVVADALPSGLTLLGVDPGPGVTCTGALTCAVDDLDPQETATFAVRMNVPADFDLQAGAVNTAVVSSSTPDPAPGNDTATATVTARAISDVAVLKWDTTDLPSPPGTPPRVFTAGETVDYRIAALNFGPSDASSARVVDTLPPGVTFVSSVPECGFSPPNQVICDLPTVPNQFAAIFPVRVRIDPGLAEGVLLTNTVEITLTDPDRVDPVSSNNLASVTNAVTTTANLNVVKQTYSLDLPSFGFTVPSSAPAGTNTGYGIDIRNTGPSVARDAVLVDSSTMTDFYVNRIVLLRPGLDPQDITASCSWSGGDLQCRIGDVPVFAAGDASWRVQVDGVTLSDAAPGEYVNTATLTSPTPDADLSDNTSQAPITVTDPVATLTIDKSVLAGDDLTGDGAADIVPGTTFGYDIRVANVVDLTREGAADAPDVVVTDTLPAGLTPTSASTTQGACTITLPSTVTCELGTVRGPGRIPAPPDVLITVSGTVSPTLAGTPTVTNTATVSSPVSQTVSDAVTQDVVGSADLSITKIADSPEVAAGGLAGFSLVVTNAGPSDAVQTEVGDLLPAEIVFDAAASDPSCTPIDDQGVTYVSCQIGTLAAGETRIVRVSGRVPAGQAPAEVVNFAAVASPVTAEPTFADNQSEVPVRIVQSADLVVTKIADTASQAVGELVTFTAAVTNAGPSDAVDVVLSDPLPAGLEFVSVVGSDGFACAFAAGTVTCTTPALAAGAAVTATIVARLPVGIEPGPIANTASASSATPDAVAGNDSATAVVDAFIIADAAITKSLVTSAPVAGEPLVFAFDVVNRGPQSAPRIVVSDALPAGMTYVSAVVPAGGSCEVTAPEGIDVVTCEIGALDVGASVRTLITVDTDPALRTVVNGALVGSAALDELSADNYDEIAFALAPPLDPPVDPPTEPPVSGGGGGSVLPPTGGSLPGVALLLALALTAAGSALVLRRRRT
ncbi:conserved repeat domain-containing protein [Microbacterium sp. RU33B]|nr:conserved repeat domain-containing protein [Microbacterium sp. RU33B]